MECNNLPFNIKELFSSLEGPMPQTGNRSSTTDLRFSGIFAGQDARVPSDSRPSSQAHDPHPNLCPSEKSVVEDWFGFLVPPPYPSWSKIPR